MRGLFTFCYSDEQMQKLEALGIEITYLPGRIPDCGNFCGRLRFFGMLQPF